jgi:preprotein translocase subunit SecE
MCLSAAVPRCRIWFGGGSDPARLNGLMAKYNPIEFIQEVRSEVAKVTWPTTKEVWITTVAVLIMVALASLFFTAADQVLGYIIKLVLGIGA